MFEAPGGGVYDALLFDMDGVIADTEHSVTEFWQRIAAEHQVHLVADDFLTHVYGRPADRTLDALFPALSSVERDAVHEMMREYEERDTYQQVPGAVPFLQRLTALGVPTALVTSGEPHKVNAVSDQLGLADLFSAWVTARDIRVGKPDPQCYLAAAQSLGVAPDRCIVFEDAVSGVQAGVAAGMLCVGVAKPGREQTLLDTGAACTIPNFETVEFCSTSLTEEVLHVALTADVVLAVRPHQRP